MLLTRCAYVIVNVHFVKPYRRVVINFLIFFHLTILGRKLQGLFFFISLCLLGMELADMFVGRDVHGSDRIGSDRTLVGSDKNYRLSENPTIRSDVSNSRLNNSHS